MKSNLLVVGSVALDTLETRAGKREDILGGSATYISLAASHFCASNLVAVIGQGDFDDKYVDLLNSKGVDTEGLERAKGRTFRWSGVYADDFSRHSLSDILTLLLDKLYFYSRRFFGLFSLKHPLKEYKYPDV